MCFEIRLGVLGLGLLGFIRRCLDQDRVILWWRIVSLADRDVSRFFRHGFLPGVDPFGAYSTRGDGMFFRALLPRDRATVSLGSCTSV